MSLETPTTKEISDNIVAQLEAEFNQTIPLLPKSFLRVLAKVLAGVFVILWKYGGFTFQQIFVRTASASPTVINGITITPLTEWGRLVGAGDPIAATRAELVVDVTVLTLGGTLASGAQLVGADNGVTYLSIGAVLLDASTVQVAIRAASDQAGGGGVGTVGNLGAGAVVSFANPLANVARDTVVDSQATTGADAEAVEVYRQRILDRFQKRPQGGAYADYELWGEEVAGITNVYPYTSSNPGQVDVYVQATEASSGDPQGVPTNAQLVAVLAAINLDSNGLATRRPATALANTFEIIPVEFTVAVAGLTVDNPGQVQTDITEAVEEYFDGRAPFIDGLSILPRLDRITGSGVSGVVDDIVSAAGGVFTSATIDLVGTGTVTLYALGEGEISYVSAVTF